MSSKVAYPPVPSLPTRTTLQDPSVSSPKNRIRPRREAAIKSQAATQAVSLNGTKRKSTSSSSSSSTLPQTPTTLSSDSLADKTAVGAAGKRKMAALPRAKRARRNEAEMLGYDLNGSSHGVKGGPLYAPTASTSTMTAMHAGLPASKGSIVMGMNAALSDHDAHAHMNAFRSGASSSKSRGSAMGGSSIREMIGGQEREVFLVDSASPPPSSGATYSNGHDSLNGLKGKRKANGTPPGSKRRRKNETELQNAGGLYNPDMAPGLYSNGEYPAAGQLSSYRGGYHAGNTYHQQQLKNGTGYDHLPIPRAIPTPKEPIDDSEGHFIVREGDYVTERYRISSLLGQGTFGKVVKCKDLNGTGEVAIKIIRAVQKYTDAAQIEIRVLRTLRENDPTNRYKCIHLLNTFTYRNHVCIVSELLGQSVFDFLKDNDFNPFPPLHIWHFAKQLLRSVAFLHSLGLVHTDLKPENILLVHNKFSLVPTTWRPNSRKKRVLEDCDIRLIDFGSATFNEEYHSQVVSTRHYRAPEIILQMGWSYPCDAWSIGCILIEFYTGEALFQTHDNLEHLAMMEAVLGPMPDDFRRKAETYRPTYFKTGRLDFPNSTTNRQSRKFVKAMKALDDTVVSPQRFAKHDKCFKSLLKKLLTFDPNQRIRVSDALKHPYFSLESHEIPP
ncbi:hypothetical protein L7F22_018936 [Adiantum nelumboides]|nr:hypothetical protein [Adiantum nelumboides]